MMVTYEIERQITDTEFVIRVLIDKIPVLVNGEDLHYVVTRSQEAAEGRTYGKDGIQELAEHIATL